MPDKQILMEILGENPQQPNNTENDKLAAILAYLTPIGLIIALLMNKKKNPFASFHIKQAMGIVLCGFIVSLIYKILPSGGISAIANFGLAILWIIGIYNAITEKQKPVPLLGKKFEDWFKNLNI